jgi:hypothetical protein
MNRLEKHMEIYSQGLAFRKRTIGEGWAVIGPGTCTDTDLRIPPVTPEGEPITAMGQCAFYQQEHLTAVVIPEGVELIDVFAFMRCRFLTTVTLPKSLEQI